MEITLTIPLTDGGYTSAKVRKATALSEQAQAALETARTDAIVNQQKNCAQLRAARLSAASAEDAWHRMEKVMTGLERERQMGFNNTFDILDASRDRFSAAREFIEQTYDVRRLLIGLRLAQSSGNNDGPYADLIGAILNGL
ncbi:TolC family protein [Cupriavidus sp. D39]|uniref:TolC family protein n=1 Tax=Cupriavidus sp. D39 TaxID=2997877 RepID=UPI00227073F6|nr:TolC family protein [Cupriavidus sp. D39]MCY0858654.1 TolC family protein [Cupriavidus sp. D39]